MLSYHNFPLIKFCRVLQDYKLLKEYGIKEEDWEAIVKEYQEINIDPETSVLLEASRRVLLEGLKLNKMVEKLELLVFVTVEVVLLQWLSKTSINQPNFINFTLNN